MLGTKKLMSHLADPCRFVTCLFSLLHAADPTPHW